MPNISQTFATSPITLRRLQKPQSSVIDFIVGVVASSGGRMLSAIFPPCPPPAPTWRCRTTFRFVTFSHFAATPHSRVKVLYLDERARPRAWTTVIVICNKPPRLSPSSSAASPQRCHQSCWVAHYAGWLHPRLLKCCQKHFDFSFTQEVL